MTPEEIKVLRIKLGLTQEKFASKLGISFSTVNRWENGASKPSGLAIYRMKELEKEEIDENQSSRSK